MHACVTCETVVISVTKESWCDQVIMRVYGNDSVSSDSSHYPQEALIYLFSLYVHKCGLALTTLLYFCINHGYQGCFPFEIIINVLVTSSRFI